MMDHAEQILKELLALSKRVSGLERIEIPSSSINAHTSDGRLSLSGTTIPLDTSAAKLYYIPYIGDKICLYNTISSSWNMHAIPSDSTVYLYTDVTINCTLTGGSNIGVVDAAFMPYCIYPSMTITGAGIPGGTTISAVTATNFTMTANFGGASGVVACTFRAAASSLYDIFIYRPDDYTQIVMQPVKWSGSSTRAVAIDKINGVYALSTNHAWRYIGTIESWSDYKIYDTPQYRLLYNYYNRLLKNLFLGNYTAHAYTTAASRPWNNDAANSTVYHIMGVTEDAYECSIFAEVQTIGSSYVLINNGYPLFGGDPGSAAADFAFGSAASRCNAPSLGLNTITAYEFGGASGYFAIIEIYGMIKS